MPERLKAQAKQAVAVLFAEYAELLVASEYQRDGEALATPRFIVMPVRPELVDGTIVQPNDELLMFEAAELLTVNQPRPGDCVVQATGGLSRNIITAHLDASGAIWEMVARKNL